MLKPLTYRLEFLLFLLLRLVARALPRRTAFVLGRVLGHAMRLMLPSRRHIALENIRHAFPDMPLSERQALLRENFCQLGISGIELLRLETYHNDRALQDYFVVQGIEHLRTALERGQGVLLLTGHIGFWEVGTIILPALGFPADFVYKQIKNPFIDRYFLALREKLGGTCINKNRAARRIFRSLGENRVVAVLIDQRVGRREGIRVDFFQRPANTTPVIAQLAIKLGTPVVPVFSRRLPDQRYEIVFEPMLLFSQEETPSAESIHAATQLMTAQIEAAVRRTPAQWFWIHDRWRP